jgi:hypothetical protein
VVRVRWRAISLWRVGQIVLVWFRG